MFRTILVAHDGTGSGDKALALALRLRHPEGRLVLVEVHPAAPLTFEPAVPIDLIERLHAEAETQLSRAAGAIPPGAPYRWETIASSSVPQALTEAAATEGADLLVVGPSHRRRFGRAILHTTGQRTLHGAPCAVAAATWDSPAIERIGVAYDGSAESDLAVDAAYALAGELGALVTLMCALEPLTLVEGGVAFPADPDLEAAAHDQAEELLLAAAARAPGNVQVRWEILRGRPAEVLPRLAPEDADLVVAGSRGHGPIRRVLLGSVSTALIGAATVPVLVTPRNARNNAGTNPAAREATPSG
jgi:nucleotide-binding universal stress UspA family protein